MYNPVHPGRLIKQEYLQPLNLTVTEAARGLGVSRNTLSEIINERSGISPLMSLRLAHAFNTTPELWMNMQQNYDLAKARQQWKGVKAAKVKKLYKNGGAPRSVA